ncbi:MAG: ABC-type transport auxiliary lipoprotein family protein [Alphaproteobacteria bacterium]
MTRLTAFAVAMAGVFLLAGCGSILSAGPQPVIYGVNPDIDVAKAKRAMPHQLTIEQPMAPRALDTDRVPIGLSDNAIQFVPNARFTDRIPTLVQRALAAGTERSGAFNAVAREELGLRTTFAVAGDLRRFGVENGEAIIEVSVAVIERRKAKIVGRETFIGKATISGQDAAMLARAYERALAKVVGEATPFIVRTVRNGD